MQSPLDYAEQIAYSSKDTLQFSYDMAVKFKDTAGVYVECGVAAGAQVIAMAAGAPDKIIYAFDSFEGIPLPSNRDNQRPGLSMMLEEEQKSLPDPGKQVLETSGATSVPLEDYLLHLQTSGVNMKNLYAVKGWFENTVPEEARHIEEIALLRLDGDLYNSTWVCLQHLFPKVIPGGCVIIDDWTLKGCQDACKEYFALIDYKPDYKFISDICYFFK